MSRSITTQQGEINYGKPEFIAFVVYVSAGVHVTVSNFCTPIKEWILFVLKYLFLFKWSSDLIQIFMSIALNAQNSTWFDKI